MIQDLEDQNLIDVDLILDFFERYIQMPTVRGKKWNGQDLKKESKNSTREWFIKVKGTKSTITEDIKNHLKKLEEDKMRQKKWEKIKEDLDSGNKVNLNFESSRGIIYNRDFEIAKVSEKGLMVVSDDRTRYIHRKHIFEVKKIG